jgi:hypothetical protein
MKQLARLLGIENVQGSILLRPFLVTNNHITNLRVLEIINSLLFL